MGSPGVAAAARDGDRVPPRAPGRARGAMRWLAVAVLAGFLGMHGVSSDHDTHLLAGAVGGHHAVPHQAAPAGTVAAPAVADALGAVLAAWGPAGPATTAHEDGCLLALTVSVLTAILALIAARRAGASRALLLPRAGNVLPSRGPPRGAGPSLFALGVLRT